MPRGSSFAPLMLKNQSRKNHDKESSWGEERKEKKMEGEEKGEEEREEGMRNDRNPRGYRGQRLSTEKPPGQDPGVQGIILVHSPTSI